MSLTSNFDYCVETGIAQVRDIFHLAFMTEDRYPHEIGPVERIFSGRQVTLWIRVLDDADRPADLTFQDEKHILFLLPFELTAETSGAPDPTLSRVTLEVRVSIPALLTSWVENGNEVLGLSFFEAMPADVTINTLEGLPTIDASNVLAAIHTKYETIEHVFTQVGFNGTNTLILYDGDRDPTLMPPNAATPYEIQAVIEPQGGTDYVKATTPIWIDVPSPGFSSYRSYGRVIFWRELVFDDTTVSVHMGTEPADPALATQVELDNAHPARDTVIAQLRPLIVSTLASYGTITEPAFSEAAARDLLKEEIAAYIRERRYPVYSPVSNDPDHPLSTPVGFLLVADEVLAILLTRRTGTEADDAAPDNFLDTHPVALAVGRTRVDELIDEAIEAEFPNLDDGGQEISTDEGEATLEELHVTLSEPGSHDESDGHLWVSGKAEVHIDCWPDPDVSFDGPIFIDASRDTNEAGECVLAIEPRAGDFDFDQSCCDVFLDLIIPIVGWIMLAIIESTIDEVGGELAEEIAGSQDTIVDPLPRVIKGIAEVTTCLTNVLIRSQGFVLPGTMEIRRLGRSYGDLEEDHDLPRP